MSRHFAVVGTGVVGLALAYRLRRAGREVTLFESRPRPALLAHAPEVVLDGERRVYDTLLYWPAYHRQSAALLAELGLSLRPHPFWDATFYDADATQPFAWYRTLRMFGTGPALPILGGQRPLDAMRASGRALRLWLRHRVSRCDPDVSVRQALGNDADDAFWRHIFPWVCGSLGFPPVEHVLDAPMAAVLAFQGTTAMSPPCVVAPDSEAFTAALAQGCALHLDETVRALEPTADGVLVRTDRRAQTFDQVILAIPPAAARPLLTHAHDAWPDFPEAHIPLVAHTDRALHPGFSDGHCVAYRLPRQPGRGVGTTIHWNRVANVPTGHDLLFSWNMETEPEPSRVLYRTVLRRTVPSVRAQPFLRTTLPALQGQQHVWYAGVWAQPGRGGYVEDGLAHASALLPALLAC